MRIGDIDRSVAFYEALGFEERRLTPFAFTEPTLSDVAVPAAMLPTLARMARRAGCRAVGCVLRGPTLRLSPSRVHVTSTWSPGR